VKRAEGYERLVSALAGVMYEPSEKYYIDTGVRVGLNDQSEDYAFLAGFGYKF
jgi:hypothetical protein